MSLLVVIVICAAGLAAGFGVRRVVFPAGQIAIYPSHVQFKEGHVEGEPLEVHFELKNESSRAVTISSLGTSCGCMAVSGSDGALKPPFVLEKWGSCPITLTIATTARIGRQTFGLTVAGDSGRGGALQAQAEVRANLLSALRAQPDVVIFRRAKPGAQVSAEVKLADALPDPGVRIREVSTSNSETMRVEVQEESGPSRLFGDGVDARARGTLKLVYTPNLTEGRIQETITIVPDNSRYPTLQIPVYCEIADAAFKFSPGGVTIGPTSETSFRRTVVFQSDDPAEISITRTPPGVTIEIGESTRSCRIVSIRGDLAVLEQGSHDVVFQVNGQEHAFPIRIMPAN